MISNSDFIMMLFQSTASSQKATSSFCSCTGHCKDFNPQLPRRKRRNSFLAFSCNFAISIHSFLAESDHLCLGVAGLCSHFNPQLPRRKRQGPEIKWCDVLGFQSTASSQKATDYIDRMTRLEQFQSTASSQKATANMHNHSLHTCINHSNTHKIIILSASIAVNPIKISNFTSANLPTFYVHF